MFGAPPKKKNEKVKDTAAALAKVFAPKTVTIDATRRRATVQALRLRACSSIIIAIIKRHIHTLSQCCKRKSLEHLQPDENSPQRIGHLSPSRSPPAVNGIGNGFIFQRLSDSTRASVCARDSFASAVDQRYIRDELEWDRCGLPRVRFFIHFVASIQQCACTNAWLQLPLLLLLLLNAVRKQLNYSRFNRQQNASLPLLTRRLQEVVKWMIPSLSTAFQRVTAHVYGIEESTCVLFHVSAYVKACAVRLLLRLRGGFFTVFCLRFRADSFVRQNWTRKHNAV